MTDWPVEAFENQPAMAFVFAQCLSILKDNIQKGPEGALKAIEEIDEVIEHLYPYTEIYKASYQLYILAVEGNLKPMHDPTNIIKQAGDNSSET
jgi:hypothetical protein